MATHHPKSESKGTQSQKSAAPTEAGAPQKQAQGLERAAQLPIRHPFPRGRFGALRRLLQPQRPAYGLAFPERFEDPFMMMRDMREEMDRMLEGMDSILAESGAPFGERLFSPQIEVSERNGMFVVRADLPGLKREDIDVEVTDDAISLSGERKSESSEEREGYYRSERSYGRFERVIPLPEGCDTQHAQASFENGVLEVTLKAPESRSRGRKVEIQDKSASTGGPVH
ncbi:MAG TPA: Hsp20/alpha crystallin family protein [Aggregicoccus sp.]|nr:Hsp20/alpha crystallin family protein [Aggregicoccus sp.]